MPTVESLADRFVAELGQRPDVYLVGIAGIPGSGKTTFCQSVVERLPDAVIVPMDGYHLPRNVLTPDQMQRRGVPDTFDQVAFRSDLEQLKRMRAGVFPGFDHAEKDPKPAVYKVVPEVSVVIVEGLYLFLSDWRLESLFDLKLFLDCDLDQTTERLAVRHLEAGIVASLEDGRRRALGSDRDNAMLILADGCRERADLVFCTS